MKGADIWVWILGTLLILIVVLFVVVLRMRKEERRYVDSHRKNDATDENKEARRSEAVRTRAVESRTSTLAKEEKPALSPMDMTPEEAEATALPFQKPIVVRQEEYRSKVHTAPIPETKNIDADCFGFFKGASVLVVEDNLINQKILLNVLKKAGILVDVANNGKEALELINEGKRYDLVIMDISMPEMDGIEATRTIRTEHPELDDMPIVTFTAFNLGPEIREMFAAGANAYLTKPLNINQLYTVFTLFVGNPKEEVAFDRMLEMHGLDIHKGISNFEGDENRYREELERFVHRYGKTPELFENWIERENFERAKVELRDMYADSLKIGAYDLSLFLKELQKYFIYRNEHLLQRHQLMFKTKLQTLSDAIELYLDAAKKEKPDFSENLAPLNDK
jgi:CheY-like chemotaxis protein